MMTQWTPGSWCKRTNPTFQTRPAKISQVRSTRQSTKAGLTKAKILASPSLLEESRQSKSMHRYHQISSFQSLTFKLWKIWKILSKSKAKSPIGSLQRLSSKTTWSLLGMNRSLLLRSTLLPMKVRIAVAVVTVNIKLMKSLYQAKILYERQERHWARTLINGRKANFRIHNKH